MRTFYPLSIFNDIKEDPFSFIGQRNFNLLECFMFHINYFTEVKYDVQKTNEFNQMPCMREYVGEQLNIDIPRVLTWTWAIGFEVENQRDLFDSYFHWLDKYENAYPVSTDDYKFNYKFDPDFDIVHSLNKMCEQPYLYSFNNLADLRASIDGYYYLKDLYNIDLTENEFELKTFIDHWKNKVNSKLSFDSWDRPLIKDKIGINPFTFGGGSNDGWIFKRFKQIIEEDTTIQLRENFHFGDVNF